MENTSAINLSSDVPIGLDKWNWGAFLLGWIWGVGNETYIALLMFIPFDTIITILCNTSHIPLPTQFDVIPVSKFVLMCILGAKGSAWSWKNKKWKSVEQFEKTQKAWAKWGVIIWAGTLIMCAIFARLMFRVLWGV